MSGSALARAAVAYAARGVPVFPLAPRGKTPLARRCSTSPRGAGLAEHAAACPLDGHGLYDASTHGPRVAAWWADEPDANIGVPTGEVSGLVVIDVDGAQGAESLRALQRRFGALPSTLWQRTPSGGWHAIFRHPGGTVRNSAGRLGSGLDVRGDGGYIVAAPSVHPNGGRYRWHGDAKPADLPGWLLERMRPPKRRPRRVEPDAGDVSRYAATALADEAQAVAAAVEGTRNDTLNRAAFSLGQLVAAGMLAGTTVVDALTDAAAACGLPGREAERTIASGLEAGRGQPREAAS